MVWESCAHMLWGSRAFKRLSLFALSRFAAGFAVCFNS